MNNVVQSQEPNIWSPRFHIANVGRGIKGLETILKNPSLIEGPPPPSASPNLSCCKQGARDSPGTSSFSTGAAGRAPVNTQGMMKPLGAIPTLPRRARQVKGCLRQRTRREDWKQRRHGLHLLSGATLGLGWDCTECKHTSHPHPYSITMSKRLCPYLFSSYSLFALSLTHHNLLQRHLTLFDPARRHHNSTQPETGFQLITPKQVCNHDCSSITRHPCSQW
jgi:hypothetical protein